MNRGYRLSSHASFSNYCDYKTAKFGWMKTAADKIDNAIIGVGNRMKNANKAHLAEGAMGPMPKGMKNTGFRADTRNGLSILGQGVIEDASKLRKAGLIGAGGLGLVGAGAIGANMLRGPQQPQQY